MLRYYGIPLSQVREHVTLWEFAAMVTHLPRDSATWSAEYPDLAMWGLAEQLQAGMLDVLHWLQWAKTTDAEKNRNRPRPIPRPGVELDVDEQHIGGDPVPLDELADWLAWDREVAGTSSLADEPATD